MNNLNNNNTTKQNKRQISYIIYRFLALLFLCVSVFYGIHFIRNKFTDPNLSQLFQLFTILIVLNLMIMFFIFYSYSTIRTKVGLQGPIGYKGMTGKSGNISTCAICEKEEGSIMEQKYDDIIIEDPILDDIDKDPSGTIVKIWDKPNRDGSVKYLTLGDYRKLSNRFRNSLQSLEVKDGYTLILYSEENFNGFKEYFPSGYYDNIKEISELSSGANSLKIQKESDISVVVNIWQSENRKGTSIDLIEGKYPILDKKINNSVGSIKIPSGYQVSLYQNENFKGRRLILWTGYYPNINDYITGFTKNVKSIIITKGQPIPKEFVSVWEHSDRKGRKNTYWIGWYNSINNKLNDKISSIEVPKGYRITVFRHENFKGISEIYRSGYYNNLKKNKSKLHDNISSLIVEYDNIY